MSDAGDQDEPRPAFPRLVWQVIVDTVLACFRYRVPGLAAEAAFFTVLSLPPLLFALAGAIGFVASAIDPQVIVEFRAQTLQFASQALTPAAVDSLIRPTLDDVLGGGRADVLSIGFLIALWSGSRALNVFIDAISIMYGHRDHRHIVIRRAMAFGLYFLFLVASVVLIPLVLAGPDVVDRLLPDALDWLNRLYWPTVLCGSAFFLAALYDLSIPRGYRLWSALPGAAMALLLWVAGSWILRFALSRTTGSPTIYGPLAAPIALLLWLYLISIAVLVGAALNAAIAKLRQPEGADSTPDSSTK